MRSSAPAAAALALLGLLAGSPSGAAYNDEPDADRVFPSWLAPRLTEPQPRLFATNYVAYEVHVTGAHAAEIHFRNLSNETWHFDFWIPGWQRAGGNPRVHLAPFLVTRTETRVPVRLLHGRPGISSSRMLLFDLRRRDDAGPAASPSREAEEPPVPGEDWMPVRPVVADAVVRRSNLAARVRRGGGEFLVEFRNPSARNLPLPVRGPGPGRRREDARPRESSRGRRGRDPGERGEERRAAGTAARRRARRPRGRRVPGPLYASDRSADAGWFALATADGSTALPSGGLFALTAPAGRDRARVRFRSSMLTPVRLRFRIPGWQRDDRENEPLSVEPGAEEERVVALDRPGDARLFMARLHVYEVSHRDGE